MLERVKPWLRALFRRRTMEKELDEELRYHIERDIERLIARGMSPEAARAAVRRTFGDVTVLREESRDARGTRWLDDLARDVRFGARRLKKSPGFTAAAVLTLALGIGMTTALFSVVHGVLMRPLPFEQPDRLVRLHTVVDGERSSSSLSPPNFMSLQQEESRSFGAIASYDGLGLTLTGAGDAQLLPGSRVSADFFEALGVPPLLGRTFRPEDNEPGNHYVVVLSHATWQLQFGGDPDVIDRTIQLNGIPHTVVGVMPPSFGFADDALWRPQPYGQDYFSATMTAGRHGNTVLPVFARLRPGVSLETARAELRVLGRRLEARFPETNTGTSFDATLLHEYMFGHVRTPLLLLFGAVGLVLLIACANVAGLLLACAAVRREEVAVRAALGARRGRIVRQLVTESLLLGLGGGALGVILAFWATAGFVALWPDALPRFETIRVDDAVLAFALGVAIGASLLTGLLPAFRAASDGLAAVLQSGGRSGLGSQRGLRFRGVLVVGQLALAVVLLVGAGLLLGSFVRLTSVDPGFRIERLLSFRVSLPDAAYDSDQKVRTFFDRLLDRIGRQPGVQSAGAISRLPIRQPGAFRTRFRIEGRTPPPGEEDRIETRIVSDGYLETMGVPVLRGRSITAQDRADGLPIVVINEATAKRFFRADDPIGRRLFTYSRSYDPLEYADAFTIVGVVADAKSRGLDQHEPHPEAYFAHAQVPLDGMYVVVRTAGDPLALTGTIRTELTVLDSDLPVPAFRTFEEVVADSVSRPRFFTTLLSLFSAVALILAAVGIFGLLSFAVAQRTHEIGIRVALGASQRTLISTVVREGLMLVALGITLGIGGALALTRLLSSQLFGVSATDPMTFAFVVLVFGAVALLATLIPAWRAATVDPLVALRAE